MGQLYSRHAAVTLELPVLISGFFHPARKYNIYSDPADREIGSNGNGVERSVLVAGLEGRLGKDSNWVNARWARSSGMYSQPAFYPLADVRKLERMNAYTIDGTWAALFLVNLGVGPDPMCPFVILAATQPDRQWMADLPLAYIEALDPSAASILAPWFS
ncbi:hypothetical protein B0H17DRAFT_1340039 [Mycena rosella]|uniref:Uncharacterized protein n=1 Tax=Mycena rosella TaxID=1033263 RepID=A0AAD7BSZ5_MYCRO|nr:hypothetical protein B0H17DRAFT_1340039 [Mycena rosella]